MGIKMKIHVVYTLLVGNTVGFAYRKGYPAFFFILLNIIGAEKQVISFVYISNEKCRH